MEQDFCALLGLHPKSSENLLTAFNWWWEISRYCNFRSLAAVWRIEMSRTRSVPFNEYWSLLAVFLLQINIFCTKSVVYSLVHFLEDTVLSLRIFLVT